MCITTFLKRCIISRSRSERTFSLVVQFFVLFFKYDQFFFTEQLFIEITFCLAISLFNAHKASHVVCCRLIILNIINIFTLTNCIQIWISPFQLEVQRLNYCENKRRMLTQWRHDYFSGNALVDSNEQHTTT